MSLEIRSSGPMASFIDGSRQWRGLLNPRPQKGGAAGGTRGVAPQSLTPMVRLPPALI